MIEFLIVLALILANSFFALSEMSLVASRKARLKQRAGHHRGAREALRLAETPERFLSTVQVGITLLGILTGMFGGAAIGATIGDWLGSQLPALGRHAATIGQWLAVGLITYLSIVLGELLPKRLALLAPERLAALVALPMHWLSLAVTPAAWLLNSSTRLILRLLRLDRSAQTQVTEEEIRMLVSESHEQGVIDDDERNMMNRVLRLGDRTAESLMTPRTRIVWLDANASDAENLAEMRATPYSRYPVYRGNDADVLGVLEVKSLLGELDSGPISASGLFRRLRPALFVSESTHALKLLEIFREEQQSLALVVDEYGDVTGMVSVNDLLGAVIGRAQSSNEGDDTMHAPVVTRADGSILVDGSLSSEDLRELLDAALPDEEEQDYHTAAGMLIAQFGRIPNVGESFDWAGWRIEVVDLDGPRVDKLLLQRVEPEIRDASAK